MPNDSSKKDHSKNESSNAAENIRQKSSSQNTCMRTLLAQIRDKFLPLTHRPGVHTRNHLLGAGFTYTGDRDTARCDDCGLEVSDWTVDMDPFTIHKNEKPNCPFVCLIKAFPFSSAIAVCNTSMSNEQQNTSERHNTELVNLKPSSNSFMELDLIRQVRRRTFSHWPHRITPSSAQMFDAGFFYCNIDDRVMCLHCNLVCEQWTPHIDNPCEVHRTLKPDCIYAKSLLVRRGPSPIINDNQSLMRVTADRPSLTLNNINLLRISNRVRPVAQNDKCGAVLRGLSSSSSTYPNGKLPSIDDKIQANYFFTDTKTNITCIYCNGLLQNGSSNDNPTVEYACCFPHCVYAKQLCHDKMYREIQECNRAQQERARTDKARKKAGGGVILTTDSFANSGPLLIPDESTLSKLVAARLKMPISLILLNQNFELSIIQRCWEDQLRLKGEDFVSGCDLHVACSILQKQNEHMRDERDVVIPSETMRQFTERATKEQAEVLEQRRAARKSNSCNAIQSSSTNASIGNDVEMIISSQPCVDTTSKSAATENHGRIRSITEATCTINIQNQPVSSMQTDICVVCSSEKRELAFLPCGHVPTCVPCGYSLNSCPLCRRKKEAVVIIHL